MSNPLVSICVPTYNRATELRESLRSICGQNYASLEILISDNGSSDETAQVCREVAASDSRVRYVRHPQNIGLYGNHNFCIEESQGEFLCFFHDHDDRDCGIIAEYVAFLQAYPDVGVVGSDWQLINESGAVVGVRDSQVDMVTPGLDFIGQTLRSGRASIGCQGSLVRRSALGSIRFEEKGPIGFADFVVWFRMAEQWAVGHIPKRLWSCKLHPQSQSTRTIESLAHDYDENLSRYCNDHLTRWPTHEELVRHWKADIRCFLFWALAFELGLHFRKKGGLSANRPRVKTLFELQEYRLSPEEVERVLQKLIFYRTGRVQHLALAGIHAMLRLGLTQPLAWATYHHTSLRSLLGLR